MKRQFYVTQYAAIFDGQNRLLLLRDAGNDSVRGKFVFPGGHIENSDGSPLSALAREIKEETGLKLITAWIFCTSIKKAPDGKWRFIAYYVCQAKGKEIKLDEEHDAFEWADITRTKYMKFRDNAEKQIILGLLKRKNAK